MSKAILIMDMPEYCSLCMFCKKNWLEERCSFTNHFVHYDTKPDNRKCPLKKVPEKPFLDSPGYNSYIAGYNDGWDDCIDKILGE